MTRSLEFGPIRPPSESYSFLLRVTRNCPWNRCKFCFNYKEAKFQIRPVEDVKRDILTARAIADSLLAHSNTRIAGFTPVESPIPIEEFDSQSVHHIAMWLRAGAGTAFLQDANSLIMKTPQLVEIIRFLKESFPSIQRVTSYARSDTAGRKSLEELKQLHTAGLSRLHMGFESGYDPLLQFIDKGVTAAQHIVSGQKVVASGISLCEYVVLGLGGQAMGNEHALHSAKVLSEINPDFIRVRTLTITDRMRLYDDVKNGNFLRAGDEEIVRQERLMLENLEYTGNFVSDHITNLLQEVEGKFPEDKERLLAIIGRFLSLPPEEKTNFIVGRRLGMYHRLDDMADGRRHEAAEQAVRKLRNHNGEVGKETVFALMEGFV